MPLSKEEKLHRHRAAANKWAAKNRERINTYNQGYYEKNKQRISAQRKARYARVKALKLSVKQQL